MVQLICCTLSVPNKNSIHLLVPPFVLGLLLVKSRYALTQAEACFRVTSDIKHPLQRNTTDSLGTRLQRGKLWMVMEEKALTHVVPVNDAPKMREMNSHT